MSYKLFKFLLILFIIDFNINHFMTYSKKIYAQEFEESTKKEFGFWLGGTFPAPGTQIDDILDSSMGLGIFYRFYWPLPFTIETGLSYGNHKSLSTQQLFLVPVYLSICYPIPIFNRFQLFAKIGMGGTYLEIRPNNTSGWDPIIYGGFEFSVLASKRFKVGLRLDGYYIYDQFRSKPDELNYLIFSPGIYDLRIINTLRYTNFNGAMYNFGLMVSFLF